MLITYVIYSLMLILVQYNCSNNMMCAFLKCIKFSYPFFLITGTHLRIWQLG